MRSCIIGSTCCPSSSAALGGGGGSRSFWMVPGFSRVKVLAWSETSGIRNAQGSSQGMWFFPGQYACAAMLSNSCAFRGGGKGRDEIPRILLGNSQVSVAGPKVIPRSVQIPSTCLSNSVNNLENPRCAWDLSMHPPQNPAPVQ